MERLSSPACRTAAALAGLLLGGLVCLAQVPPAQPRYTVADVTFDGLYTVSPQRVRSLIKTQPGKEFAQHVIDEDVRQLAKTNYFRPNGIEVRYQPTDNNKVLVHFIFKELPNTIQEIVYNGAKHLKPDELNTLTGLRRGAPMNPTFNKSACQSIIRRYHEQGRAFAECHLVQGDKPGDTRVVFNIAEGPVVKVRDIQFTGNHFVSGGRLKTQINSKTTLIPLLSIIGGDFNPAMLEHDIGRLEEYYKSFGYHRVRVARSLQWSDDQRYVTIIFHVEEGERYKVAGTQVEGTSQVPREQIEGLTEVRSGRYYNRQEVNDDLSRIRDHYGYLGYGATVQERLFYPGEGLVQVHYEVQEPLRPDRVGQIFIVGNEVTRQNVILRQIPLYPGQILTYPDLRVAERNLERLGIFEVNRETGVRPTVQVIPGPDPNSEVKDLLVTIPETRTGSVMFGLGVNSDAGFSGSIVLNEKNFDVLRWPTSFEDLFSGHAFRGGGQDFRVEAVPGTQVQRYSISLREPFLFDTQFGLTLGGYYYTRIYEEYTENRLGTRISLDRKLNKYWSASAGVRVENVVVSNFLPFAPSAITDAAGDNFLLALSGGVSRDSRDSYLRPTEGSRLDLSYTQFLGGFTFPQLGLDYNKYWTTWQRPDGSGRHVLAFHTQVGWSGDETPVYERYYAGGFRSLRGFRFRGVGPNINGFMVGGDFIFLNSLEYQVPIRANDQIYLVGFVDTGTVEPSTEIKNYRVSAGVGMRFTVPMLGPVPIALDFGFPINKADTDREQLFSFWIGFFR
jgi:outer membrane protein assembly complex protein YaeT